MRLIPPEGHRARFDFDMTVIVRSCSKDLMAALRPHFNNVVYQDNSTEPGPFNDKVQKRCFIGCAFTCQANRRSATLRT